MKTYDKMLLAFHEKSLNCHAKKGDWLYIAHSKDTKKSLFRLPDYLHYFVSLNEERMPSEFGVVKKLTVPITSLDLALLDYDTLKKDSSKITSNDLEKYTYFLDRINSFPEHTPLAVTWMEKVFPRKEKIMKIHKKFFTDLDQQEKDELFIW